jgi:hypothetical protein
MGETGETDRLPKSYLLSTKIIIFCSTLFMFYLIFVLPGSSIDPNELAQYNWLNQS